MCGVSQCSWWAGRPAEHNGPTREGGLEGQEARRHRWGSQPGASHRHRYLARKKGKLCPLEAMLRGIGEPESWLMDCSPPPLEEDTGGELGWLEEAVTE